MEIIIENLVSSLQFMIPSENIESITEKDPHTITVSVHSVYKITNSGEQVIISFYGNNHQIVTRYFNVFDFDRIIIQ